MINIFSVSDPSADPVHQSEFLSRTAAANVEGDISDISHIQPSLSPLDVGHLQSGSLLDAVEHLLPVASGVRPVTIHLSDLLWDSVEYFTCYEFI